MKLGEHNMFTHRGARRWLHRAAPLALLGVVGCGPTDAPFGDSVTVSGSFNGWAKGPRAPKLLWDGARYVGQVWMPGDRVELRLPFSTSDSLAAGTGQAAPVPSTVFASEVVKEPIVLETPLNALYELSFDPQRRQLHVDFASDADADASVLPPGGVKLIQALRGTDRVSEEERGARAAELQSYLQARVLSGESGTPLSGGKPETQGFTFLRFEPSPSADAPPVALIGDFNGWGQTRSDHLLPVLGGRLAYKGLQSSVTEVLYRFQSGGESTVDPLNPEFVVDGGTLPPNLDNVLGGNQGSFSSIARGAGFFDPGSRLHRVPLPQARGSLSEVYVYLPQNYAPDKRYPVLYVHDGRDALTRGRYHSALDVAIMSSRVAPLIAVFVPGQSDSLARLSDFTAFSDDRFPDVAPQADAFLRFFTDTVMRTVEGRYPIDTAKGRTAMLGVDMAGAFSFYVAWKDTTGRFTRVASQSGRFGWGYRVDSPNLQPFVDMLVSMDKSAVLQRLSIEYLRGDGYQVGAANQSLQSYFLGNAAYKDLVYLPDPGQVAGPTNSPWDLWSVRLQETLGFLLMGWKS